MFRVVCYFLNWEDSFYIPFLAKHYGAFCERIVMMDQSSNDGSQELAESLGIEVRQFGNDELNDQVYLDVKNNCWKECRGTGVDYVIVVDADEFVTLPATKHPFPLVKGYNMISDSLPVNDIFEINTGAYSENYSKQAIFNPDFVKEIAYVHGCHRHNAVLPEYPKGEWAQPTCQLYHFRQCGGVQRMIDRHAVYRERMSGFNKRFGMGVHYLHSDEAKREEWDFLMSKAEVLTFF